MNNDNMELIQLPGAGSFKFSAVKPMFLGSTSYTLATLVVDRTGTVSPFANLLVKLVKDVVNGCKKHPRAENLLLRVVTFANRTDMDSITEVHGFMPVNDIKTEDYKAIDCGGMTNLYDAVFSSISATLNYSKTLVDQDFNVNGAVYVITDGADNISITTMKQIAELMSQAITGEKIESLISLLIGVNATDYDSYLQDFKVKANITQYIDAGDVTEKGIAKLSGFISKSLSSVSQSLGTGGPSQTFSF